MADEDGGAGTAVVDGAREYALVPETEDARSCTCAVEERRRAFLSDDFEAPGEADERDESPDDAGDEGQYDALGEGELYVPRHPI